MHTQTIPAHFDGRNICLDGPVDLRLNEKFTITLVRDEGGKVETDDEFRDDWHRLSVSAFAKLYEREEREYGLDLIKKPNPRKR